MSSVDQPTFETTAEEYLALLRSHGIERVYVNAGTDFAPIVEAYARLSEAEFSDLPKPVLATHENLAVGMAHGAYLVTRQPQAVMFHVSVGTANAVCGVFNAARDQVPLLVTAGRTPLYETGPTGVRDLRIHWAQEMFDQGGLLRELVKWDYELRDAVQVSDIIDRALTIATTEPKGPVYLTLPREVLASAADGAGFDPAAAVASPTPPRADPSAITLLAERLTAAELPIIASSASGADPATVEPLARLCDRFGIGYADEGGRYMNMPADHPLHLGYGLGALLQDADVFCFIETDVPWTPKNGGPRSDAFVAQCGVDPLFASYPVRGHRSDLSITSTAAALIADLEEALESRIDGIDPGRRAKIAERSASLRQARAATSARAGSGDSISREFLNAIVAEVIPRDALVFNEYWASPAHLARTLPGSYFSLPPSGGLGWGLPAALGAKQATPGRTVVATLGDGAYMFANPAACHHVAKKYGLPVLTIINNNARWGAVDLATGLTFPDGHWRSGAGPSISDLEPMPALEKYVEASGGHGEMVADRQELGPSLRRALHAVENEGRDAVVNVLCE